MQRYYGTYGIDVDHNLLCSFGCGCYVYLIYDAFLHQVAPFGSDPRMPFPDPERVADMHRRAEDLNTGRDEYDGWMWEDADGYE